MKLGRLYAIIAILLALSLLFSSCDVPIYGSSHIPSATLDSIPTFNGSAPYVIINDNVPFFTDDEIDKISVVAPNVVLNTIRDYNVVEKREVKMPDEIHNIIKCNNLNCITNNEPMATHFYVENRATHTLKCRYCEKEVALNDIKLIQE